MPLIYFVCVQCSYKMLRSGISSVLTWRHRERDVVASGQFVQNNVMDGSTIFSFNLDASLQSYIMVLSTVPLCKCTNLVFEFKVVDFFILVKDFG